MTSDEQTLYFFAFRYALPRQSYALSLVSDLVLRRVDEFEDWQLRDMIGEIEAHWEENNEIHPIDRDVQRLFRDRLQDALSGRSAEAAG
jgi:hypothetical protein